MNLWFDHETPDLRVESIHTHDVLRIIPLRRGPIAVRIPHWLDASRTRVEPANLEHRVVGSYLRFSELAPHQPITLHAKLTKRELVLKYRTRDIRVRLRGNAVEAMDSFGTNFTYLDEFTD